MRGWGHTRSAERGTSGATTGGGGRSAPDPYTRFGIVDSVFLHCDVDKMYYSVEAIETPSLGDEQRAVIISVNPREYPRAVVTTANGVARAIGINSGMSTAIA